MKQHENAIRLIESVNLTQKELNEATTRSRIIDTVLYDILSIPKNAIIAEEHINKVGYTDYTLLDQNNDTVLIIEAKKEGIAFTLPTNINIKNKNSALIKVKTLLTDSNIKDTITQVRQYCLMKGVEHGAITNGHVWIFFTVFSQSFENLNAFVIYDLKFFSENFTEAYNLFNYNSLIRERSLYKKLNKKNTQSKQTYSIKENISSFNVPVDFNEFAQYLEKPIRYYFSDFKIDDIDFLENCYVEEHVENTKRTLSSLLVDNATPYLENNGVINHTREKLSKKLSKKVANYIDFSNNKHIIVIYGDRGCGKSTFIKKLLHSDIPKNIQEKLSVIHLDLLEYAPTEDCLKELKEKIWKNVLDAIDVKNLRKNYSDIQNILFKDEFTEYREQISSLYAEMSEKFSLKIEAKIEEKLKDYRELAIRLAKYLRDIERKEIILVLDNTDQFSSKIQDYSFQILSEIFSAIKSLSIITIREERFFRSKKIGVLDAYETVQYHIASPKADKVFIERLDYIMNLMEDENFFYELTENRNLNDNVTNENFKKYLNVFKHDFHKKSNLYNFLVSCAQKDMRKALDLFRSLVTSGYMNITEMLSTDGNIYTLQIHQVLKPLMTPQKYFYQEKSSLIPNIFQLRNLENGSHFTSIRILKYLHNYMNSYTSLSVMKSEFFAVFNMEEDFIENITLLIEYKLIEADIKVDGYIPEIENITITPYGEYFISLLIHFFSYLDLICSDCEVYDEQTANSITKSAEEEFKLFSKQKKGFRLIHRISKTDAFLKYLIMQEKEEKEAYNLDEKYLVVNDIIIKYQADIKKVRHSASRQSFMGDDELSSLDNFFDKV
jgi:GTPase SAR1 family protein